MEHQIHDSKSTKNKEPLIEANTRQQNYKGHIFQTLMLLINKKIDLIHTMRQQIA